MPSTKHVFSLANRSRVFLAVVLLGICDLGHAQNMEISLNASNTQAVFGDPVYVKVTIVNRGREPVFGPPLDLGGGFLCLRASDPDREVMTIMGPLDNQWDRAKAVRFMPGEPIKHYGYLFLPGTGHMDEPFWKPLQEEGQAIHVSAVYRLSPQVELNSRSHSVHISPRNQKELELLEEWGAAEFEGRPRGPTPNDFGIPFQQFSANWLFEAGTQTLSGQLGVLFHLSLRMQRIFASPPESQEARNRELVEWLQKQHDVRRDVLTTRLLDVAEAHGMASTIIMLEGLLSKNADKHSGS